MPAINSIPTIKEGKKVTFKIKDKKDKKEDKKDDPTIYLNDDDLDPENTYMRKTIYI